MEDRQSLSQGHRLTLDNRENGTITGVLDVVSFDEKEIILLTKCGTITIKGSSLHVEQLSLEQGQVDITGSVNTLLYTEDHKNRDGKKESVLGRLFK